MLFTGSQPHGGCMLCFIGIIRLFFVIAVGFLCVGYIVQVLCCTVPLYSEYVEIFGNFDAVTIVAWAIESVPGLTVCYCITIGSATLRGREQYKGAMTGDSIVVVVLID